LGPDHPLLGHDRTGLGITLLAQDRYAEAEQEHRAALALQEAARGPDHPDAAMARNNLAIALHAQGKYAEAEAENRAALAAWLPTLGEQHPFVAVARSGIAQTLFATGRTSEALPLAELAWARQKQGDVPGSEPGETAFALARILWSIDGEARDRPRARALAQKSVEAYRTLGDVFLEEIDEVESWLDAHPLP
jgi:tetratricopeptide (TPR) repeat protein